MTFNTDRLAREATLPGIVQTERSEYDLICYARDMHGELSKGERLNLNRALEAGKALNKIKEMSPYGTFEEKLNKTRIPKQRASEYMRLAKCPACDISHCQSIREALILMQEKYQEEDTSEEDASEQEKPKTRKKRLNKKRAKAKEEKPKEEEPKAERQPGEDPLEWDSCVWNKDVEKYCRQLRRAIGGVSKMHEVGGDAALAKVEEVLKWFRDSVEKPFRPVKPAKEKTCKCGTLLLRVVSERGIEFNVSRAPSPGGKFVLQGGLARYVPLPNGEPLHMVHQPVCPMRDK